MAVAERIQSTLKLRNKFNAAAVTTIANKICQKVHAIHLKILYVFNIIHSYLVQLNQIYIKWSVERALCLLLVEYVGELFKGVLTFSTILSPVVHHRQNAILQSKLDCFMDQHILPLQIPSMKYRENISAIFVDYFDRLKIMAQQEEVHEFQFQQVVVELVCGSIVDTECDVIVNSVDPSYQLNLGQISASIYKYAGEGIQRECNESPKHKSKYFRVTSSGQMSSCAHILHFVVPNNLQEMSDSFLELLQYTDSSEMKSIAVPCIGLGNKGHSLESIISFFIETIVRFTSYASVKHLHSIKIVTYKSQEFSEFLSRFENNLKSGNDVNAVLTTRRTVLDNVSKWNQTQHIEYVDHKLILGDLEEYKLMVIAKATQTSIKIELNRIKIEALKQKFVWKAVAKVTKLLTKLKAARTMYNHVQWHYWTSYKKLLPYPMASSFKMEMAFLNMNSLDKRPRKLTVHVNRWRHQIDLETKKYSTIGSEHCGKLCRKKLDLPSTWNVQAIEDNKYLVEIAPSTEEFQDVVKSLDLPPTKKITIVKIERVQNKWLHRLYSVKKEEVQAGLQDGKVAELVLYHGTNHWQDIVTSHFNRSYVAEKNGALYGRGTYFATSFHDTLQYSKPDDAKLCRIIQASVLVGNYTKGTPSMKAPVRGTERFDSTVDSPLKPTKFAVYHDASAYPKYVITFKF